jgi:endonuclease/exonuclease/phosphatase family metal-dependent hydrolase
MKRIVRYIFLAANVLVGLLLATTYLVPYINPKTFWMPSLLGLGYPYLLMVNLAFVVLWLIFRRRYLLVSLVFIMPGMSIHKGYYQFFPKLHTDKEGIKILSYNVENYNSITKRKETKGNMFDFIAASGANIICMQEAELQKTGKFNPIKLKSLFPGIKYCQLAHQSSWNGPVTFSSFPIIHMGEIRFTDSNNMVIFSDIKFKKDTIRVYNCHLQSYGIKADDYSVIDTPGLEERKIKEMRAIGAKLKSAYIRRSNQVTQLVKHIKQCPYPVIVCGDFNDTPISYTYHSLDAFLVDAYVESGWGVSTTYRGKLPPYRIDYIFCSKDLKPYNYKRIKVEFSDHFPVSATIVPKNDR